MKIINVHIGEVRIAKNGEVLKAILGSCVGIGLIWKEKNICGLAHCLLPESPVTTFAIGARFVNQAVPSLLALMKIKTVDLPEIYAVIAGGGNMTSPNATDGSRLVGSENFKVTEQELSKAGIQILHSDGGGTEGRKIILNAAKCSFQIERIPRIVEAA